MLCACSVVAPPSDAGTPTGGGPGAADDRVTQALRPCFPVLADLHQRLQVCALLCGGDGGGGGGGADAVDVVAAWEGIGRALSRAGSGDRARRWADDAAAVLGSPWLCRCD